MKTLKTRIRVRRDTTANWNSFIGFVPMDGEVIVYTDRLVKDGKNYSGIKIGDGKAYCVDLPFIVADSPDWQRFLDHENNWDIHVSTNDRDTWDSCEPNVDEIDETLFFGRTI